MPRALKYGLIGCGGLLVPLVLFVGCLAVLGRSSSDSGSSNSSNKSQSTTENTRGKAKAAKGEETVAIGQPITVGKRGVDSDRCQARQPTSSAGRIAKVGQTEQGNFVIVDFDFTNNGNNAVTLDNESLKLVDSQGRTSGSSNEDAFYVPRDRKIFLERVNPGVTKQGEAIFQVAPDASGFRLQAGDANTFSGNTGYVDLGF